MTVVRFLQCVVDLNDKGDYDFLETNPEGEVYHAFNVVFEIGWTFEMEEIQRQGHPIEEWIKKGICEIVKTVEPSNKESESEIEQCDRESGKKQDEKAEEIKKVVTKKDTSEEKIQGETKGDDEHKNTEKNLAKQILDKYATAILRQSSIIEKNGVSIPNLHKVEDYTPDKYKGDEVLWIPPKDCIRLEFEHDDPKTNLRCIRECESAAKALGLEYCITSHEGKSPYLNSFNIKGMPVNEDGPIAKALLIDLIMPEPVKARLDRSNLGWTHSPVIGHPHWKKKYGGNIHEIIRGINPLEQRNEYPKDLLKQIKKSKVRYKSNVFQVQQQYSWAADFLINYCCKNKLPVGNRNHIIEKNLAVLIIYNKNRDKLITEYLAVQERKHNSIKGWLTKVAKGDIAEVSAMELKRYIDDNNIPYKIPATEKTKEEKEPEKTYTETEENLYIPTFYYEPVINNDQIKWLIFKHEKVLPILPGKTAIETLKNATPSEIRRTFKIREQGIWMCTKCETEVTSTKEQPEYCYNCKKNTRFEEVTEVINPKLWKLPKWDDIPVEDIDMLNTFNDLVKLLKSVIVFIEPIQYKILALWIFSLWKFECWNTVGWPLFLGLPDSGKSRGLDIIRELGWRMLPASNCTFKAMVRASDIYHAGILLDEVQNKLSAKTERGQEYLDFVKPSYRKGTTYTMADPENPKKLIPYENFSFKAMAGEALHDKPAKSRCILFEMEKDYPEIDDMTEVQDEFDRIQTILLNYKYKMTEPDKFPKESGLRGRTREVYETIIRTGEHIGLDVQDVIEYAKRAEEEQTEEFRNSIERDILRIIYTFETFGTLDEAGALNDAPEIITIAEIGDSLGWDLKKERQKLGYILRGKGMGLRTFHTRRGAVLKYVDPKTRRKLNYLYKRYGVDENA